MEVILLERVEHLGQMGDVVQVRPGYARNYLMPQGKAVRSTGENRRRFDARRAQLEATNLQRRSEAEAVSSKMEGLSVILIRQAGEAGQLYGSVSGRDLADAITEAGFSVSRQQVRLKAPIKALGIHDVDISLHPEVIVSISVNVARSQDEAVQQARTGSAFVRSDDMEAAEETMTAADSEDLDVGEPETAVTEGEDFGDAAAIDLEEETPTTS